MRAAFKFRHESWLDDEVFDLLRASNVAFCIADTEKLSTPVVATADYGYLRLGPVDYSDNDVARLAGLVREKATNWQETFIYFKHEESGMAPRLAAQMIERLGK